MEASAVNDKYTYTCALSSHGDFVFFRTNSPKLYSFLLGDPFVRHHIPNLISYTGSSLSKFMNTNKRKSFYTVTFNESNMASKASFYKNERHLFVQGLLDRDFEVFTFTFCAVYFFSRLFHERSIFGMHCGGVSFGENAILFMGGAASGKSTLTSLICSQYGASFLCDERALLRINNGNQIEWIGGNTILTLRPNAIDYLDCQQKTLLETKFTNVSNKSVAKHKISYQPWKIIEKPLPVRHVIYARLSSGKEIFKSHHLDSAIFNIYASLSEDIHGIWAPFLKALFPVPSLDTDYIRKNRLLLALGFKSENINIWEIEGDVSYVSELVAEKFS
jgi:hypothetical protein